LDKEQALRNKGFGKPNEAPKLLQADINRLEKFIQEYAHKRKQNYPNAAKFYDEAIKETENTKKAMQAKEYEQAFETKTKALVAMTHAKPIYNESSDLLPNTLD
jgi:hypothetical protein